MYKQKNIALWYGYPCLLTAITMLMLVQDDNALQLLRDNSLYLICMVVVIIINELSYVIKPFHDGFRENGARKNIIRTGISMRDWPFMVAFFCCAWFATLLFAENTIYGYVWLIGLVASTVLVYGVLYGKVKKQLTEDGYNRRFTMDDYYRITISKPGEKKEYVIASTMSLFGVPIILVIYIFVHQYVPLFFVITLVLYKLFLWSIFFFRRLYWRHSLWCSIRTAYFEAF